jgi:hypothetical protein
VAGVAGGLLLGRKLMPKRRKVLGVPVPRLGLDELIPSGGLDLKPVAKSVSKARKRGLDGLIPSGGLDVKSMAKTISKAGKRVTKAGEQMSQLSGDVQRAGQTAQRVADTIN